MSKKIAFIFILVVVVLLGLVVWLIVTLMNLEKTPTVNAPSEYSAVYLTTGDIYFGKLSMFPNPRLTNVWFIQKSLDAQNQPQFNLMPIASVSWGPTSEIFLNSKEIVFWTRLRNDSQVVKALTQKSESQFPPSAFPSPIDKSSNDAANKSKNITP